MRDSFAALPAEKMEKIVNAALQEFAEKGYKAASINTIIAQAGISKGSLFHHFSSKMALMQYLYQYCIQTLKTALSGVPMQDNENILQRWKHFILAKIEIGAQYPLLFDFVSRMAQEEDEQVRQFVQAQNHQFLQHTLQSLEMDLDKTSYAPGVDAEKASHIIRWALTGYANDVMALYADKKDLQKEHLLQELDAYIEILQSAFLF